MSSQIDGAVYGHHSEDYPSNCPGNKRHQNWKGGEKRINSTVLVVTGTGIEDQSSDGDTSK